MSVASHLNIRLDEYDERIRTFVPGYEQMLSVVAQCIRTLDAPTPEIVDLGTGTGALAARCLEVLQAARLIAVDSDADIMQAARLRLADAAPGVVFIQESFVSLTIPACDAVVASLALHHVHHDAEKRELYRRCRRAVRSGGLLVTADCFPPADPALAEQGFEAWRAHLRLTYTPEEADAYLQAWSREDRYRPLESELRWLREAGFMPEVVWRVSPMAVIAARAGETDAL